MLNLTFWLTLLFLLISIIELLRRKVLREKYAIVWLVLGLTLIFGASFPGIVNTVSQKLGFQYLSNFVLFIFSIVNLLIAMQLSLSLGKSETQIQNLTEELALTKLEIDSLKKI